MRGTYLKVPMANSIGNDHLLPPRPPARLLVSVLLLGTFLAWWGTRDSRQLFGEPPRRPIVATPENQTNTHNDAQLARGLQIEQQDCAGCHEMSARSSGPSYRQIVTFYLQQAGPLGKNRDLLSELAAAVAHPQPGWANFTPGPPESSLAPEDRIAVASWILNLGQKKGAAENKRK